MKSEAKLSEYGAAIQRINTFVHDHGFVDVFDLSTPVNIVEMAIISTRATGDSDDLVNELRFKIKEKRDERQASVDNATSGN